MMARPTLVRGLTLLVAVVWATGFLASHLLPQLPDGDLTAIALFEAQHPRAWWNTLRNAWWLNSAGAALIGLLLAALLWGGRTRALRQWLLLGLLLWMSGWLWHQTRGWQGVLYLAPHVETPLGVDGTPHLTFERFLRPPAPSGPGPALQMRLNVDGRWRDVDRSRPYRVLGWELTPLWYGAIVESYALREPLYFGSSGTQVGERRRGDPVRVTLHLETLALGTDPPLRSVRANHYAIVRARFAPVTWMQGLGGAMSGGAAALWLGQRWKRERTAWANR